MKHSGYPQSTQNAPRSFPLQVPAYIQHPRHAHAGKHGEGGAHAHGHQGYGYKVHEVDIQTAVNKFNHAQYLGTHVRGEVAAVCGDYAYQPDTECAGQ